MLIQADLSALAARRCGSWWAPASRSTPRSSSRSGGPGGSTVRDGYGQTETTAQIGNPPGQPVKPGSMGRPLPGYAIVAGRPVTGAVGDEGEICLDLAPAAGRADDRLPRTTHELTAEAMRGGCYHTGDVARRDADGYITYVGRTDDVFKASDYRISPFELECVLIEHPAVAEAAVVPSPDPVRLAVPKAYVVLAAGLRADAGDRGRRSCGYCREQLAPYKRIRRLEFAELPKTISGKIRRVELRGAEDEASRAGGRPSSARRTSRRCGAEPGYCGASASTQSRCSSVSGTGTPRA